MDPNQYAIKVSKGVSNQLGACQIRLITNQALPKYSDVSNGVDYAKINKGENISNIDLVRKACAETDYLNLLAGNNGQFCKSNPSAQYNKEVVLYDANGTPKTSAPFVEGANLSVCPPLYLATCQVRTAKTNSIAKYNDQEASSMENMDFGSGYAKLKAGGGFADLQSIRTYCAVNDIYAKITSYNSDQFCRDNPGAKYSKEVVLYNMNDETPATSGYLEIGKGLTGSCPGIAKEPQISKNNQKI